jgi:hypothetical protein
MRSLHWNDHAGFPCRKRSVGPSPVEDDTGLRVEGEMAAHGQATEVVRSHEKLLRASFRIGLEIENTGTAARTWRRLGSTAARGFP